MLPLTKSQLEKYKSGWIRSFCSSFSQDENGDPLPWMTYPFIEFISDKLNKNHVIFEYGFGASTLFFAKKVKKVVAIESNAMWLKVMQTCHPEYVLHCHPERSEGSPSTHEILCQDFLKENIMAQDDTSNIEITLMQDALTNSNYENFAANYKEKFDFIFIDSLKRFECAKNSIAALKDDGILILDDSQRKGYKKIFEFFEKNNFKKQDFVGIAPGQLKIKNTTVFWR
ncbi:MAG: hypothetical protein KGQ36_02730 [Rickettsiales bacterium]|nr:hypothetical protein [Rickettsiales bacterium]